MTKHLTWYDYIQYISLLLFAAAIPVGWHCALWASGLLALASLVAAVAGAVGRRRPLAAVRQLPVWGLWLIVAYWLLLLVSMLWSADVAAGREILWLKAVMLIFPLSFLLTDVRWLTALLLRGVGYAYLAAMVGVFLYYCGCAVGKMMAGTSFVSAFGTGFDPRHHAYTAIYLAVALAFVYCELHSRWSMLHPWHRGVLIAVVPMLVFYVIMVNSRAGMLTLYALEVACTVHFALTRRRWWHAALMAILLAGFTVGVELGLPSHESRVASTVEDITSDEPVDARVQINGSSLDAALQRPLFGYGVGDYRRCLVDQYNADDFSAGVSAEFNAHNQYVETALAVGAVGLLLFMAMLLLPLWAAWRRRSAALWLVTLLTFIVGFNLLFESMLERQMGLLLIAPLLTIMALIVNGEENKFGQLPEK